MAKVLKIVAKLETSDHDGYCTGEECDYDVITKTYYISPPKNEWIYDCEIGDTFKICDYEWATLLPIPNVQHGFGTCRRNKRVLDANLLQHDYRYTILSVKMICDKNMKTNNK